jgi:hypothetical protein
MCGLGFRYSCNETLYQPTTTLVENKMKQYATLAGRYMKKHFPEVALKGYPKCRTEKEPEQA